MAKKIAKKNKMKKKISKKNILDKKTLKINPGTGEGGDWWS